VPRPNDAEATTRGAVLRGAVFALAVALGAVAVWLIVTSTTNPRRLELGVLAGLWGGLLGAFAIFGSRRVPAPLPEEPAEPKVYREAVDRAEALTAEIQLRSSASLERAAEAEERRSFEAGLQTMLKREIGHIRDSVSDEVASLRSEVAGLRAELVEKVGGQLRLERIETTRVIGSDLEALQHEVRALKFASRAEDDARSAEAPEPRRPVVEPTRVVEPARVRPVSRESAQVQADVQPAVSPTPQAAPQPAPQPTPQAESAPESAPAPAPAPQPAAAAPAPTPARAPGLSQPTAPADPPSPSPAPAPQAVASTPDAPAPEAPAPYPASPAPGHDAAPFAGMPRITPFTAFELDPVETEPAYSGRRRRAEEARRARHAAEAAAAAESTAAGRRRRQPVEPDHEPRPSTPSPRPEGRHDAGSEDADSGPDMSAGRHGGGRHDTAAERPGSGRHGAGRHSGADEVQQYPARNGHAADDDRYDVPGAQPGSHADTHDGGVDDLLNRLLSRNNTH
jgi:hypothetical protein